MAWSWSGAGTRRTSRSSHAGGRPSRPWLSPTLPAPAGRPRGQHRDVADHDLARRLVHDQCTLRAADRGPGAFGSALNHLVNVLGHQMARVARRSGIERRAATTWKADPTATSASQRHGRSRQARAPPRYSPALERASSSLGHSWSEQLPVHCASLWNSGRRVELMLAVVEIALVGQAVAGRAEEIVHFLDIGRIVTIAAAAPFGHLQLLALAPGKSEPGADPTGHHWRSPYRNVPRHRRSG